MPVDEAQFWALVRATKWNETIDRFRETGDQKLKRGGDTIYGELTGEAASKNRDTQYFQNQPYIVKGFWKQRTWGDNNDRHENVFYITDIQTL